MYTFQEYMNTVIQIPFYSAHKVCLILLSIVLTCIQWLQFTDELLSVGNLRKFVLIAGSLCMNCPESPYHLTTDLSSSMHP